MVRMHRWDSGRRTWGYSFPFRGHGLDRVHQYLITTREIASTDGLTLENGTVTSHITGRLLDDS